MNVGPLAGYDGKRLQRQDSIVHCVRTSRMTPSQSKIKAQSWLAAGPPAKSRIAAPPRGCCLSRDAKIDLDGDKTDAGKRNACVRSVAGMRNKRERALLMGGMVMVLLGSDLKASLTWIKRRTSKDKQAQAVRVGSLGLPSFSCLLLCGWVECSVVSASNGLLSPAWTPPSCS